MRPAWQSGDFRELEFLRDSATFGMAKPFDLALLLCDVAGVLGLGLDGGEQSMNGLFAQGFSNFPSERGNLRFRTTQPLNKCWMIIGRLAVDSGRLQQLQDP